MMVSRPLTLRSSPRRGAVTLFYGLPSDHVRGIAEDADGTLWFGTDGGLARYDGRRTQTIVAGAVRALARDATGVLWVGTEDGASRVANGQAVPVPETAGLEITAILAAGPDRVVLASGSGTLFTCSGGGVTKLGPEDDPLGWFLESVRKLCDLPDDTLVLPSHGKPFRGIRARVRQLVDHHDERCAVLVSECGTPRSAGDLLETLFPRPLDTHQSMFAMGEAIAHLNYLVRRGRLQRTRGDDGVIRHLKTS